MKKIFLVILLGISGFWVLGQPLKLSRSKQILIMHNIDSLIQNYEFYCTLSEGIKITKNQQENFLALFKDSLSKVFDDINPNYTNNNTSVINEKDKPVLGYVSDIEKNYQNLYCRIMETDAGEVVKRIVFNKNGLYVSVTVLKELDASTKDSVPASYRTTTNQRLVINIEDTILCKPYIYEIVKSGESRWVYTPPATPTKRWEKLLSINAGLNSIKYNNPNWELFVNGPKAIPKIGLGIGVDFRYLLKEMESYSSGVNFGLGLSYLKSQYSAQEYVRADWTTDKYNDTYYKIRDLDFLVENQTIIGINIPVKIDYERGFGPDKGLYLRAGGLISYYFGTYKYSTDYDISGFYPKYDIFIKEEGNSTGSWEAFGFGDQKGYTGNGSLPVNHFNLSGDIDLGMYFRIKNNYKIYAGLNFSQAFLNFSSKEKLKVSGDQVFTSLMSEMGNVGQSFIGIKIGIKKIYKVVNKPKTVNKIKPLN